MPYQKLNTVEPAPKQKWEHIKTKVTMLILAVKDDTAYCVLLDGNKTANMYVKVPLGKFKHWGNRGMLFLGTRKGSLPKVGDKDRYGEYSPRKELLGAI